MPYITCPVCKRRIDKAKGMTDKLALEICARSHPGKLLTESTEGDNAERPIQSNGDQGTLGGEDKRRTPVYTKSKFSRKP